MIIIGLSIFASILLEIQLQYFKISNWFMIFTIKFFQNYFFDDGIQILRIQYILQSNHRNSYGIVDQSGPYLHTYIPAALPKI